MEVSLFIGHELLCSQDLLWKAEISRPDAAESFLLL